MYVFAGVFYCFGIAAIPFASLFDVICGRHSPVLLVSELAEIGDDGSVSYDMSRPLLWIYGFIDWLMFLTFLYVLMFGITAGYEAMLQSIFALRSIR